MARFIAYAPFIYLFIHGEAWGACPSHDRTAAVATGLRISQQCAMRHHEFPAAPGSTSTGTIKPRPILAATRSHGTVGSA